MGMPGRKSAIDEAIRDRVIGKAWGIIDEFFDDPKADKKEKREIATKLATKNIPQDLTTGGKALNIQFDGVFKATHKATEDNTEPEKV